VRSDDPLGSEMGTSGRLTARLSQPSSEPEGCKPYVADDLILFFLTLLFYPFYFPSSRIRDRRRPLLSSPATADHVRIDALRHLPPPLSPFGADALALACSSTFALSLYTLLPSSPFVAIAVSTRLVRFLSRVQPRHIPPAALDYR